jgi:hypothetical protein
MFWTFLAQVVNQHKGASYQYQPNTAPGMRDQSNQLRMSPLGQSRRFEHAPATSGLPQIADMSLRRIK